MAGGQSIDQSARHRHREYRLRTTYESHQVFYARNIPAFENLTNLTRLPATGATVIALPMKIGGGSGAPLRAVAVLPSREIATAQ